MLKFSYESVAVCSINRVNIKFAVNEVICLYSVVLQTSKYVNSFKNAKQNLKLTAKNVLTFHVKLLLGRRFTWNVKTSFL